MTPTEHFAVFFALPEHAAYRPHQSRRSVFGRDFEPGGAHLSDGTSFDDVIIAIHEALGKAERQLPNLGDGLQFLVGEGTLEIVRRGPTGETLRPKVVVAELPGCDAMLWRPEHPAWIRCLEIRSHGEKPAPKNGNGQPSPDGGDAGDGGDTEPAAEPPAKVPEEN